MGITLSGRYRDRLLRPADGPILGSGPERSNVVVYRALDLIAELLSNRQHMRGILYWAVGSGDPAWDADVPAPDRTTRRLVNETYRKRIEPARDLTYDTETRMITVRLRLEADEANGTLREFGLFGGDASARPGSGYLINHAIHPAIEKTSETVVERELRLTFGADGALPGLLDLVGRLLRNEPGLAGIRHVAAGSGDPAWDGNAPEEDPAQEQLIAELYREPVQTLRDIEYVEAVRTLVVRAAFGFGEATGDLREFGVFGGDSTTESGSGQLLSYQIEPVIDHTLPAMLVREFRITLGSDVVIEVPDVTGQPVAEAQAALIAVGLTPGTLREIESDTQPGQVVEQAPEAGSLVAEGSVVSLGVAAAARVELPNLFGLTLDEAAAILNASGLELSGDEPATEERPDPPGTIVRQSPPAGSRVEPATTVSIMLAVPVTTVVPDLAGLTPGGAEVLLLAVGLALTPPPFPVVGSDQPYDSVVAQQPVAGERVATSSSVTITLAAPWSITVPGLLDLTPDAAATALREAASELLVTLGLPPEPPGLVLGSQVLVESESPAGTITGQSLQAGESAPLYGAIDISVAIAVNVAVPDLTGMAEDEATLALDAAGLTLLRTTERIDVAASGTVVEQDPRRGSRVARGTGVTLFLAKPILVEVPLLVGRTLAYAQEVVASRSLVLAEVTRRLSEQAPDIVLEQTPASGEQVPIRSSVQIVVSSRVPNVVGLTPDDADPLLTALTLTLAQPLAHEVSDQPVGTILRQDPAAGTVANEGTAVTIVLAARVPSLLGMTMDEAELALATVGLQLTRPGTEQPSEQPAGTIISQEPEAGAVANPGESVSVVVAVGVTVEVPSVLAMTVDAAQATLAELGLTLIVGEQRPSPAQPGTVIEQSPAAGTPTSPGSTVTVVVAVPLPVNQIVGALGPEPDTLYVHSSAMLPGRHVLQALYDGPFDARRFEYLPVIFADRPEVSLNTALVPAGGRMVRNGRLVVSSQTTQAEQMRVIFRLREGITWDDGQPLVAKDSVFSFQLASTSATPTSSFRVVRTESYDADDDLTVVWTGLPGWTDAAPLRNFWPPLPTHLLDGVDPEEIARGDFSRRPSSYGPFVLEEWREGSQLLLARHPAYFRADEGLPAVDRIELRVGQDSRAVFEQLQGGELDMALVGSLGLDQLPELRVARDEGRIELHEALGTGVEYLMLCLDRERTPFFLDTRVRQAMAHAIDRQAIVEQLYGGNTEVAHTFMPRAHPFHMDDLRRYGFDPDMARSLLAEAGFADGFSVSLLVPEGRSDREKLAEMIAGFLAEIGIQVDLQRIAPARLFAKGQETPLFGRQFEMALFSWDGGIEPPAELFLSEEVSDEANGWGAMNVSGYRDKAFDSVALQAMSALDTSRQRELWIGAQQAFAEDLPAIPLFQVVKVAATRPGFQGMAVTATQPSEMRNVERFSQ